MAKSRGTENNENELHQTRKENERLRAENRRLKALLESFALRPASSLRTATVEPKDKETSPKQRISEPSTPRILPATCRESSEPSSVAAENSTASQEEKIALFRSLFRGREDVYAVRWESRKGKSGYSPACAHEWDPLLCHKPCAKCGNGKYLPISDEVIRDHVLGKHTWESTRCFRMRHAGFSPPISTRRGGTTTYALSLMPAATVTCQPVWSAHVQEGEDTYGSSSRKRSPRRLPESWGARY